MLLLAKTGSLRLGLLFALSATAAFPQGERATISGTVTDSTSAMVAGAAIAARNVDTNVVSRTMSNASGLFVIPALPPGTYEVTAEKQGFRTVKVSNIPLSVGLTATVDVKLDVGQVSES